MDVAFTVAVGGALVFGMNLFLLGWLMGDLRPSARSDDSDDDGLNEVVAMIPDETNVAVVTVNKPATNAPMTGGYVATPASKTPATNSVKPTAPPNNRAPVTSGKSAAKQISVKSISKNASNSTAILSTGVRNYTILLGETIAMQVPGGGLVVVRCVDIKENTVDLTVEGEPVSLSIQ